MNDTGFILTKRFVTVLTALVVFISAGILLWSHIDFGTAKFVLPDNAQLKINGHVVTQSSLKLRAGTYTTTITSPTKELYQGTLSIGTYKTTTYKPILKTRQPLAILTSVIGASGTYGAPGFTNQKWFDNNTYLAGIVGPGSAAAIALHYVNHTWTVAYYDAGGSYPSDVSKLPSDVSAYITAVKAQYAD